MNEIIRKNILLSILLLLGLTNYTFAAPDLPVSTQMSTQDKDKKIEESQSDKIEIEIVPEIKIEVQATTGTANPKLKTGDACSDEKLEELKGELFNEVPMAKTIPCDKVDCKDLAPAKMYKDNYKKLNDAKTISCGK